MLLLCHMIIIKSLSLNSCHIQGINLTQTIQTKPAGFMKVLLIMYWIKAFINNDTFHIFKISPKMYM